MNGNGKKFNKEISNYSAKQKNLFRSYYCAGCKQRKPCQLLTSGDSEGKSYCCHCFYQTEQAKVEEYNDYQQVYQRNLVERQAHIQQYQLLKDYLGCPKCGSLAVDAYSLYSENRLVCQPCRMKKEGGSSSPISFLEQGKGYKKRGGIILTEWLDKYGCLPVNAECAIKWLKDKKHLDNCQCLEIEAKGHYLLVNDNLKRSGERLKECKCVKSEKVRVSSDNYAWCESCEKTISVASKKRVIKNRNDPRFGGLEVKEKVLCLGCLEEFQEKMPPNKKYTFNKYQKRYEKKEN